MVEEGHDAPAGNLGRWRVVATTTCELPHHYKQGGFVVVGTLVVIEEGVSGLGIFLHVVIDPRGGESLIQPLRRPTQCAVLGPTAADDGAGGSQEALGVSVLRGRAVVTLDAEYPWPGASSRANPPPMQ